MRDGYRKVRVRKGEKCRRWQTDADGALARDGNGDLISCANRPTVAYETTEKYGMPYRDSWCYLHDPARVYVNTYREYRAYGGPEEGGWWYNVGEPIGTTKADHPDEAQALCAHLWDYKPDVRDSESRLVFMVERHPARRYPRVRPHYE